MNSFSKIILLFTLLLIQTELIAKNYDWAIQKEYDFSIKQNQEHTFLYHKSVLVNKWKNEWYSCDKDWWYGQGDLLNAKSCISDELWIKNQWYNWYSFKIFSKNYHSYYLYNTKSKILYTYWFSERVLQSTKWKNWVYFLFSVDTSSPWNEDTPNEFIIQFKTDGTYKEVFNNTDKISRLVSYELLPKKKIQLNFLSPDFSNSKIITVN